MTMRARLTKAAAWLSALPVLLAVVAAGGCALLPSVNSGAEGGVITRPEQNSDLGGVELVLYPVAVWGGRGASPPVVAEVGGREILVRKRRGGLLDRPRVKMGLFWNSRGDDVYLLVAVSGPPAIIRGVELHYDGGGIRRLAEAGNVRLIPGRNVWDGGDGKSPAVYAMKPDVFSAMLNSGGSRVLVDDGDGVLDLDWGSLRGDSPAAMRQNAKVLFWQFYDKMTRMRKQK